MHWRDRDLSVLSSTVHRCSTAQLFQFRPYRQRRRTGPIKSMFKIHVQCRCVRGKNSCNSVWPEGEGCGGGVVNSHDLEGMKKIPFSRHRTPDQFQLTLWHVETCVKWVATWPAQVIMMADMIIIFLIFFGYEKLLRALFKVLHCAEYRQSISALRDQVRRWAAPRDGTLDGKADTSIQARSSSQHGRGRRSVERDLPT